jgi:hypothetical protein
MPKTSPTTQYQDLPLKIPLDRHGSKIGKDYAGFSYEKSQLRGNFFSDQNQPLVRLFNHLGPSILRIGGNSVDKIAWQHDGPPAQTNAVTAADVDALASFLRATGWSTIYGINLARNTPAQAAQEAAYVAQALGPLLYAFEIGNEPDAYSFNGIRSTRYTYADFIREWRVYAQALKQAVPAAVLSGPASAWHESSWTEPFAYDEAQQISLLTQHYYRANGLSPQSTLALLLAGDPALPGLLTGLRDASEAARIPGGYRLTEANSFYDGGAPHISNTFGSALWALDFLFITAGFGSSGVNFHGGGGAPGYTPIADDGKNVIQVRPEYYAMLLFARMGEGALIHNAQTAQHRSISTYVVAAPGQTKVLISNKESSLGVNIVLSGDFTYQKAEIETLSAPALDSTDGVTLNRASIGNDGGWSPAPPPVKTPNRRSLSVPVAPATAVLVTLGQRG